MCFNNYELGQYPVNSFFHPLQNEYLNQIRQTMPSWVHALSSSINFDTLPNIDSEDVDISPQTAQYISSVVPEVSHTLVQQYHSLIHNPEHLQSILSDIGGGTIDIPPIDDFQNPLGGRQQNFVGITFYPHDARFPANIPKCKWKGSLLVTLDPANPFFPKVRLGTILDVKPNHIVFIQTYPKFTIGKLSRLGILYCQC
uniref:Uncharacterized protein n=1 Tax=Bacillus thuringiensis TaxID=1428 RepID=B0FXR7_BACTU|nr:hypothetical protein [Bacillus thuringiensis]ABY68466.1 hypothetical protein pFR12_08 [Bacillus thuringiensis]